MQTDFTGTPTILGTFTVNSNLVTISAADNDMSAGTHYFFSYQLKNREGNSPMSDVAEIALADYPSAPSTPNKIDSKSSVTSMQIEWSTVPETQINVIGYELWMDSGSDGLFNLVFSGRNRPGILTYLVEKLETGRAYRFKVRAVNFNGNGPFSNEAVYFSCLPPQ